MRKTNKYDKNGNPIYEEEGVGSGDNKRTSDKAKNSKSLKNSI